MSTVFTNGCFDLLHVGHLATLRFARNVAGPYELGGRVVVGLNSDDSIRRIKGPDRPIIPQWQRHEMLHSLSVVDKVFIFNEDTPLELIKDVQPDIIVKGPDYAHCDHIVGEDIAEVLIVPPNLYPNVSTSSIIERIKGL